jgi:cysteinyl-tRNA synthetase
MSNTSFALVLALAAAALIAGFAIGWLARRNREAPAPAAGTSAGRESRPATSAQAATARSGGSGGAASAPAVARPGLPAAPSSGETPAALLGRARSWGYQLQELDLAHAAASPFDILVIDPTHDGSDDSALQPAEVARLKRKPDGSRRLVIAYLSIGEAESYRGYWRREWKRKPPQWLLGENPEWDENYSVCFWDPGWQALMCGSRNAALDRILAQGFDGVYLDKCDVTHDLQEHEPAAARQRPDLEADMVAFVRRLVTYARERHPGFLFIMQNAETLLERPELRALIDASGKEELLYGLSGKEKPNSREEIEWARDRLDRMRRDGKPVLMVEYLDDPAKAARAAKTAQALGYVLFVSDKSAELDHLEWRAPLA